jgi:hypothetical protein
MVLPNAKPSVLELKIQRVKTTSMNAMKAQYPVEAESTKILDILD